MELVSVIMSTYNETNHDLDRAIASILNQSHSNIEFIIICDNPNNRELLNHLQDIANVENNIILSINEENVGLTESLNKAISLSHGDFIARMDADDYSFPTRLECQLAYLKKHYLDLVGCYVECVDENEKTIYYMNNMPVDASSVEKKAKFNNPVAHPTWLAKKTLFIQNNSYRNVPYAEDYDFLLRAIECGAKVGNLNEILFKYTIRDSSISKSNGLRQFLMSKALIKQFKSKALSSSSVEELTLCLQGISTKDERKFATSSNDLAIALKKMQKKNITFVWNLISACLRSKYFTSKLIGYIRAFF